MKFSDLITPRKTVPRGAKGWQDARSIAKELGFSVDATRKKLQEMILDGRVESAGVAGHGNAKVYRVVK